MHAQSDPDRRTPGEGSGSGSSPEDEQISAIISEFSEFFAFTRSRWSSYANDVHADLKGVGLMMMQLVLRKGPVTATGISQMLDMDKALVSRQIAKLRELGFVAAEPAPEDRRVVLLTATPRAQELMSQLRERWAHLYHERFEGWSIGELEQLRRSLHRFNTAGGELPQDGPATRCARGRGGGAGSDPET
ncbi:MarR family winged helix-turn-helix transcriptional regulator [Leucobacter sp. wl10]|uniref:MarR family winged helix-turn-helix transcriptional regulator n=1 Tax=Leucobacter sp. wl10 TaxID=2304677 RepID=UPI000E5C39CB|nr:MarR family transcriptional regulator [Leucobacter sp. wl10]RGE23207.1 MarR family transcriptional regulator [Leucobacter sp. wl10]